MILSSITIIIDMKYKLVWYYNSFQNGLEKIYLYAQVAITISWVISLTALSMNKLISSIEWNNLLVKDLFNLAHIFSAGLSSGEYDGRKKSLILSGIFSFFALWIEMREKEGLIPKELSGYKDIVFDGYCNPIETLSHSFVCKPIYLRLFRRRYKRKNRDEHFSNEYDVSLKGVRLVPEMGFFLIIME